MPAPIGLLGGTFDPIHLGHLNLALSIFNAVEMQTLRLLPCGLPNLREPPLATAEQRLAMVTIAVENHPHLQVDEREIKAQGDVSYTIDTLMAMRAEIGDTPLCFIISVDQLCQFDQWRDWQHILDFAHLIVSTRPGVRLAPSLEIKKWVKQHRVDDFHLLHQQSSGHIFVEPIIPLSISASHIRQGIHFQEKDISSCLPKKVWEYICRTGLYR